MGGKKKNKNKMTAQPPNTIVVNPVQLHNGQITIDFVSKDLLDRALAENKELKDELSRYKNENTILIGERDRMSMTIKELQEENEKLRKELAEVKAELSGIKKELAELKNDKVKTQLLAAAIEILEREKIKETISKEVWKKLKKPRNESAHYLYEDNEDELTESEKLERYKLFKDVYEKHKGLLTLDRWDNENNNKIISMLISKIDEKLNGINIDETSKSYIESKEDYWIGCF